MTRETLTDEELEIVIDLARGLSLEEIGINRSLSRAQRRTLMGNIHRKYGVGTHEGIVAQAYERGDIQRGTVPVSEARQYARRNVGETEYTVFWLLKIGWSTEEIAEHMKIAHKTIYTYCYRVRQKLGVDTNEEVFALLFDDE